MYNLADLLNKLPQSKPVEVFMPNSNYKMSELLRQVPWFQDPQSHIYRSVIEAYSQPWRHFHTIKHVENLLLHIRSYVEDPAAHDPDETDVQNTKRTRAYLLAAVFHDVVYEPWCRTEGKNELESVAFMYDHLDDLEDEEVLQMAAHLIRATGDLNYCAGDRFTHTFLGWDRAWILQARTVTDLIRNGHRIWQEYSFYSYQDFVVGHMNVVRSVVNNRSVFNETYVQNETVAGYETYLQSRRPRLALYPGSFNPYHVGHSYVAAQARAMFDKVVIATGVNPSKFTLREIDGSSLARIERGASSWSPQKPLIDRKHSHVYERVDFSGMLSDLVRDFTDMGYDVVVVKGVRNAADLESEMVQAEFTRTDNSAVKYAYIPCPASLAHVSSSAIRILKRFGKSYTEYIATSEADDTTSVPA